MKSEKLTVGDLRDSVNSIIRQNPHLTLRAEKAAFLVLLRQFSREGENRFRVESEDGLQYYEVVNGHCDCSDYVRHGPGHPCKHRLALLLTGHLDPYVDPGLIHLVAPDNARVPVRGG